MTVWIVMQNDFPIAVFASEDAATKHARKLVEEYNTLRRNRGFPREHYHLHSFELQQ